MTGAGTRSIITLTQAGLPLASARSSAGPSCAALVTSSPCPPSACSDKIVTRGQQVAAVGALRAVLAQLDLVLGVPGGIVADDSDEGQVAAHGGVELGHVEAEGAVAHDGDHGRRRVCGAGGDGERDRRADGAGGTVDEAAGRRQQRLRPLPDLAAVAHEDGVGVRGEDRRERAAQLDGVQLAGSREASVAQAGGR